MNRVKANEDERSRAASIPANEKENETVTEVMNGLIVTRPAKKIEYIGTTTKETQASEPIITDLQNSKAGSTEYKTVIKEKRYEIPGSSTGELIHKCGTHNYETKSLKEFNQHIALHKDNDTGTSQRSKTASVPVNKLQEILRFQRSNGRL